jgi:hypothetical protein
MNIGVSMKNSTRKLTPINKGAINKSSVYKSGRMTRVIALRAICGV